MKRRVRPRTQPEIKEFRRRALIDATIESLAENGVANTTVRTICKAAGISPGLLTHYYESKDELMAAAFRDLFTGVTRKVQAAQAQAGDSAYAQLKALPAAIFSAQICTRTNRYAFLTFWHDIRFSKAVRQVNRNLYSDYTGRMQKAFAAAAREHKVEVDAESAAIGFVALIDGLWLELTIDDRVVSGDNAIRLATQFIDRQLGLVG